MITVFYAGVLRTTRYQARRFARWARKHPRRSVMLGLLLTWLILSVAGATSAYAAGDGDITLPWLPPSTITDSHGVSLTHYAILPLDRGDTWTLGKTFIANVIDPLWAINIAALGWLLWMFQFLLSFQWVGWISTPLGNIADLVQGFVSQIGWIPFALMVAGGIGGLVMLSGRYAKGAVEIAISVMCSVLAVGMLANPVTALTGDHGALHWAESWGGNLASSVVQSSDTPVQPTGDPDTSDATDVISTAITGQLMDIFVRRPAQVIAFGHELTGDCDKTFTTQMEAASPIDSGSNSVRNAVGGCDSAAGTYVTHPNFGQVFTTGAIMGGSGVLLLLGLGFALVLLMAVFYSLFQALKLMGAVYLAVAPGVAREALWKSLIGMYVGAFSVGMSVVILAAYLKILTDVLSSASSAGVGIFAQTLIIDMVVITLLVTLFVARHRAKKAGETLAARLARLGFGSKSEPKSHPLASSVMRTAESFVGRRLAQPRKRPAISSPTVRAPIPATSPVNGGEYTATPAGKPAGTGGATAGKVLGGAKVAGQLAVAAATGGTSAVAMQATKVAGKTVLQRHLRVPEQARTVFQQKTASAPRSEAFGRKIVVDSDGVGRIAPNEAPRRDGAYQVTTMRPRRSVTGTQVRAALERASGAKEAW
jgi:hypothetical protein